jgi:hypothetical protein
MRNKITRREFISGGAIIGAVILNDNVPGKRFMSSSYKKASMPMIRLGEFRVSRLILGTNPFWGFWHGNPRKPVSITEEGKMAVMDSAADNGITAVWAPAYKEWITLWKTYKAKGGRLESWMGQPDGYKGVSLEEQIRECYKNGGKAICIQGLNVDEAIKNNDYEKLKRLLGMIRDYGLNAGLASHNPENILKAEESGLPAEFYHLTLGIPDTFESGAREKTLKTVQQIEKPMVIFKVLGAGRFEPNEAIPYVLNAISRKDGICLGADNPAQIAGDAEIVINYKD